MLFKDFKAVIETLTAGSDFGVSVFRDADYAEGRVRLHFDVVFDAEKLDSAAPDRQVTIVQRRMLDAMMNAFRSFVPVAEEVSQERDRIVANLDVAADNAMLAKDKDLSAAYALIGRWIKAGAPRPQDEMLAMFERLSRGSK